MKAYKVNVNGKVYEITLEVIDKEDIKAPAKAEPVKAEAKPQEKASGAKDIAAPMPGNILKVNVTAGQSVKKGDVLMVLEAMKMENEIMSPSDAVIASVNVTAGATVETGALLCRLA